VPIEAGPMPHEIVPAETSTDDTVVDGDFLSVS